MEVDSQFNGDHKLKLISSCTELENKKKMNRKLDSGVKNECSEPQYRCVQQTQSECVPFNFEQVSPCGDHAGSQVNCVGNWWIVSFLPV